MKNKWETIIIRVGYVIVSIALFYLFYTLITKSDVRKIAKRYVKEPVYVTNKDLGMKYQYYSWVRKKHPQKKISDFNLSSIGNLVAWNSMYINQELERKYQIFKNKDPEMLTFQDYEKALDELAQMRMTDKDRKTKHTHLMALIALMTADFDKSIEFFNELGEIEPSFNQAKHSMLAIILEIDQKYKEAIDHLKKHFEFLKSSNPNNLFDLANTLERIAWDYVSIDDYSNALSNMQAGKQLIREWIVKNPESEEWLASFVINIGEIYYYSGQFNKALDEFGFGIAKLEKLEDSDRFLYRAYSAKGRVLLEMNQYGDSARFYEMALSIKKRLDGELNEGVADTAFWAGIAYQKGGNNSFARTHLQKALEIYTHLFGENSHSSQSVKKWLASLK